MTQSLMKRALCPGITWVVNEDSAFARLGDIELKIERDTDAYWGVAVTDPTAPVWQQVIGVDRCGSMIRAMRSAERITTLVVHNI